MVCEECGHDPMIPQSGYLADSLLLGPILVQEAMVDFCPGCGAIVLEFEAWGLVDKKMQALEHLAIKNLPIGEFITLNEAAELLGTSKQAVSKNKRIQRGFVISLEMDGRRLYYQPSVVEYGRSGDGRIKIGGEADKGSEDKQSKPFKYFVSSVKGRPKKKDQNEAARHR